MKSTLAARGDEPVIVDRVAHHAAGGLAVMIVGDGHTEMRDAVDEVVRAIDRVDDPEVSTFEDRLGHAIAAMQLFTEDGMIRKRLPDDGDNGRLGLQVGLGDEVVLDLTRGRRLGEDGELLAKKPRGDCPADASGLFGDLELS